MSGATTRRLRRRCFCSTHLCHYSSVCVVFACCASVLGVMLSDQTSASFFSISVLTANVYGIFASYFLFGQMVCTPPTQALLPLSSSDPLSLTPPLRCLFPPCLPAIFNLPLSPLLYCRGNRSSQNTCLSNMIDVPSATQSFPKLPSLPSLESPDAVSADFLLPCPSTPPPSPLPPFHRGRLDIT